MAYVVAGVFITLFLYAAYRVLSLHLYGSRTLGTIIELKEANSDDITLFHPIVEFTTSAGNTIIAENTFSTSEAGYFYHVGQRVEVLYSLKNPHHFAIVGYDAAAVFLLFLFAAGISAILYWRYILQ